MSLSLYIYIERETDRQTDRQTDRPRERDRDRQRDRQTENENLRFLPVPVTRSKFIEEKYLYYRAVIISCSFLVLRN